MTREEFDEILEQTNAVICNREWYERAIKALEQERSRSAEITQYRYDCEKLMEENERLKKALEQEPCEDCISRFEAIEALNSINGTAELDKAFEVIEELPPVTPNPKTGHWIEVIDEIDSFGNKTWHYKCSICGNENSGWGDYKYCPNCGARMFEPQESEG